jgi:hypothetical protein
MSVTRRKMYRLVDKQAWYEMLTADIASEKQKQGRGSERAAAIL